ncbi:DUF423 domain-containing protein [Robiginitalea sp. IMCC43444]|uniref:DUF423 domain-containing protein n=1 Tax=Robiginitalea sp. IMCC43444 TaxID=3459121 RepID=UPI00404297FF
MNKTILITAGFLGITAVVLGALGAHALAEKLPPAALKSFSTGVEYQMFHALFLLFLGSTDKLLIKHKKAIFWLIFAGVICFSFSIYGLSTQPLSGLQLGSIALVTPLGGLFMISGWALLIYRVFRSLT